MSYRLNRPVRPVVVKRSPPLPKRRSERIQAERWRKLEENDRELMALVVKHRQGTTVDATWLGEFNDEIDQALNPLT